MSTKTWVWIPNPHKKPANWHTCIPNTESGDGRVPRVQWPASLICWALCLEKDRVWKCKVKSVWGRHMTSSCVLYTHIFASTYMNMCTHIQNVWTYTYICIIYFFSVIYFSIAFHISELICSRMNYLEGIVHFEGCGLNKKGKITLISVKILTGRTLGRNVPLLAGLMLAYSGGTIVSAFLVFFFSSVSSSQWLTDVSDQC